MKARKTPKKFVTELLLCLCIIVYIFNNIGPFNVYADTARSDGPTKDVTERVADQNTMEDYIVKNKLLSDEQGSRYAGRIWTDKTVFAYDENAENKIGLTYDYDGYAGEVGFNADFAHVFSALSSTQLVNEYPPIPVDLMLSIDITASMLEWSPAGYDTGERTYWCAGPDANDVLGHEEYFNCSLKSTLNAANALMEKMREYSKDTRISVVVYWGTGYQMIPFVDGDVQFTGYSVRRDNAHPEAIIHYTISGDEETDEEEKFGDYVYDPVSGAHYKYPVGKCPLRDTDQDGNQLKEDSAKNGKYLKAGDDAVDAVSNLPVGNNDETASIQKDSPSQLGAGTDVEAGIYTAMSAVAEMKDITHKFSTGKIVSRIPAVVILGDGNTNHLLVKADDSDSGRKPGDKTAEQLNAETETVDIGGKWWAPLSPQKSAAAGGEGDTGRDGAPGSAIGNLTGAMQGAYWKAAIKHTYNLDTIDDVKVYTIGVWASPAVLNPAEAEDGSKQNQIPKTLFNEWKENNDKGALLEITVPASTDTNYNKTDADPFALGRPETEYKFKKPEADNNEDPYGVKTADLNLNYPTKYYRTDQNVDIKEIFELIFAEIMGEVFVPVSGVNDAGVSNSLTYQDPLGDYMEIKNRAVSVGDNTYDMSLLLFGKMHGITRAGVYDYSWNDEWMQKRYPGYAGQTPMDEGWYKGDDPENAETSGQSLPEGCTTAKDAWAAGWVYRLSFKNLIKFVPVSDAPESGLPADLSDQIKSTVYTVYRIDDEEKDANKLQMNPVYGDAVPEGLVKQWEEYYDTNKSYPDDSSMYAKYPGVYRLNDIRIWGEEYGDFVDTEGAITPNPAAYDASLYINVPVAALPAQLAEITLGPDGVTAYKTNLNDKTQSTPLRVFYAVGLSEDLIIRNDSGEQTGVNMGAISEEYKSAHRDGSDIWFISNFYSNTPYEGYVSDDYDYRTRGDPTVSFSPSPENRYYVMQKPLPIYAHAYRVNPKDGSLTPVDCNGGTASYWQGKENIGGNGKTEWETLNGVTQEAGTWDGGLFMGVYKNEDEFKAKYQAAKASGKITDSRGETYQIEEDAIVFFESDIIDHVQAEGNGYTSDSTAFNSDDYFFLLIEYYLPIKDKVGTDAEGKPLNDGSTGGRAVKRAITRKGGEFGSGLHSVNIGNGDMLCWTDMNGHITVGPDYRSYTETGDKLRGEPTFDRLYGTGGDAWWQKVREDLSAELAAAAKEAGDKNGVMTEEEFKEYFHWAVAAKPGGVRVGDMFHNRETKSENTTQTASNYYIPTLSTESGVGNDIVLNSYLGNNGRLKISNQTLLMTKLLDVPGGALTDEQKNKEFHYQVYIDGMEGTQVAERVKYNPYSKTWQRHIASIDVLTDNSDLLLDSSSKRAFFDLKTEDGGSVSARQVVANAEGRLVYADEYGSATDEPCEKTRGELYNIYLPDNAAGDRFSRRIYNDEEAENYVELTQSGRTIYVGDADAESENQTPSPDNLTIFKQAADDRPAGTVEYWALNAELIPITDVDRAEQDGGTWSHPDGDTVESYKKLPSLTLYIDRPSEDTSATDVATPFKTRTMYLTKTLEFGIAVEELYDNIIPSGDRPAFAGMDNAYIAQHTAEYTLKHGEGLLFTGLSDLKNYRFTEKLEDTELAQGYNLKEVSHVQQYGSKTTYRRGFNAFEDLGDIKPPTAEGGEPFYHTNAQIWESYATYRGESDNENLAVNGNHHEPEDRTVATSGETGSETIAKNPVCREDKADETQDDKSVRHYFVRDGELVDKHYKGEQSAFDNNRYVVGATAHFLVNGETQEDAKAPLPVEAKTDYAGVYSVFGNTGAYEEQAHFVNEVAREGSITVLKVTGKGDVLEGAEFTLYELVEASDGKKEKSSVGVQTTRLAYMEKLDSKNPSYDKTAQVFTDADGKRRPVHTDEKGELYYFRFLNDGERTAYYDAVKAGEKTFGDEKLECERVRAVAEFTGLDVSKKYKLEETKIPDGYILTHQPNETFDFLDGEGNPVINIIYEVKNFSPLELPETGRFVTCVITLGALIALVGLYMMRKQRRGYSPRA